MAKTFLVCILAHEIMGNIGAGTMRWMKVDMVILLNSTTYGNNHSYQKNELMGLLQVQVNVGQTTYFYGNFLT